MLEIAIVGAGICGLTLGRELAARGVSFALFEARERLGGRVLSVQNPTNGERLDLGPTWFWPDTQPAVRRLAEELGLERFDQHDPGSALLLSDPEEPPATREAPRLHAGAQRLKGGMASLAESLAATIPQRSASPRMRAARGYGSRRPYRTAVRRGRRGGYGRRSPGRARGSASPARRTSAIYAGAAQRRSGGDERDADMDGRSGQGRGRLFGTSSLARGGTFRQRLRGSRSGRARRNLRRLRRFRREGGAWRILRSLGKDARRLPRRFADARGEPIRPAIRQGARIRRTTNAGLGERKIHLRPGRPRFVGRASRLWLARAAPIAMGRQALSRRVGNRARGRRLCRRSDQRRHSHP